MSAGRTIAMTIAAMTAFAGNSLLARAALRDTTIDAMTFTSVRLTAGAVVLVVLSRATGRAVGGSWPSALALFAYAALFSFAYVSMPAGTGALILFAAVQATMIGHALSVGDRFLPIQTMGLVVAAGGLVGLLLPGLTAPPALPALAMAGSGVAWGIYSLRGRRAGPPLAATAGNFLRAVPFAIACSAILAAQASIDVTGLALAAASGAVASGLGYAIWYAALPGLAPTSAATAQLSVPVIAAAGAVLLLGEPLSLRLVLASAAVLGGIALVITRRRRP